MPVDDPAMHDALARYNSQDGRTRRRADLIMTIFLLGTHGILLVGTVLALTGAASTGPCVYSRCVEQPWFQQAFGVAVPAAGLIFVADVVLAALRFAWRKLAFVVPVVGCAVQLALTSATYTMIAEAGLA